GIDHAMVGGVRLVHHPEAARVTFRGKLARVRNRAADGGAMAGNEVDECMYHGVGTAVPSVEENRGDKDVVEEQRRAGMRGHLGERVEIDDITPGVADGFAEDGAGPVIDMLGKGGGVVAVGKPYLDPLTGEGVGE